jgi:uncharacterized protein (UPF0261 family)
VGAGKGKKSVLVIATLDTKSEEVIYLKNRIEENGLHVVVLDTGILGEPKGIVPDIPASQTAIAGGMSLEDVRKKPDRGSAVDEMLKGAKVVTARLFEEGRIHGAISFGGAEGAVMAAAAMQVLPPGFPKVITTPPRKSLPRHWPVACVPSGPSWVFATLWSCIPSWILQGSMT